MKIWFLGRIFVFLKSRDVFYVTGGGWGLLFRKIGHPNSYDLIMMGGGSLIKCCKFNMYPNLHDRKLNAVRF